MTPIALLDELQKFIEEKTQDMLLPVRVDKGSGKSNERAAEVHKMRLPNKDAETKLIPYILLQFIKGTDDQQPGQNAECKCNVRIVAATYSENAEEGATCVLNLLTRVKLELIKAGVVGNQFLLCPPLEMFVYPDSTPPYYLGEMMSVWKLPAMESEVERLWH